MIRALLGFIPEQAGQTTREDPMQTFRIGADIGGALNHLLTQPKYSRAMYQERDMSYESGVVRPAVELARSTLDPLSDVPADEHDGMSVCN